MRSLRLGLVFAWLGSFSSLFSAGCGKSGGGATEPDAHVSATIDAASADDAGELLPPDAAMVRDTWGDYAHDFFATYCVSCHSGGSRDYRTIDDVVRDAALIRCGVTPTTLSTCTPGSPTPRQFPIGTGAHPSDGERARLVAWLDDGAPL